MARHLAKLFDSMAKLKFKKDADGEPTKEAVGMYSKDGEYVDFDEPCKCVGQVFTIMCMAVVMVIILPLYSFRLNSG